MASLDMHTDWSPSPADAVTEGAAHRAPATARDEGQWRVFPMEGALELAYSDAAGNPSRRRIIARELKIGPGKTLLGGIDMADDGYRGFRADRIDRVVDAETGETIDRNIIDWLIKRAEQQAKERRKAAKPRR